ncbi:MAG: PDZ domain-containing protein [Planctomycetota bacterium]|nr:MAG: PDZ domain-containing protein [Planctomycetota bacterium]
MQVSRSRPFVSTVVAGSFASLCIVASGVSFAQDATPSALPAVTPAIAPTLVTAPTRTQIHVAIANADPYVQAFNEHLTILASPWMEGRLPGTRGMERAMDYMEDQFKKVGLDAAYQPSEGGAKTYRQPFSLGATAVVVEESITAQCGDKQTTFVAGTDFKLTLLGKSGSATGPIAFVGYGLDDGPDGYSSFTEGHSLEGKIALVLRFEPMDAEGKSRWSGGEGWSGRAGFQGKLSAIAQRKPAAIIVVNTPGANDPRVSSLSAGGSRPMCDVPVFMMSAEAATALVASCESTRTLMELRTLADEPLSAHPDSPMSFDLAGPQLTVAGKTAENAVTAQNIVGVLPGRGALASEVIIIGGHLDHLGQGDFGSREGPGKLHPGADDNASGAAGVILLGDMLKKAYDELPAETPLRTVLFMGFSAEESGLNGSRHYVNNPIYPIVNTVLMMNFDMIGRMKDGRLSVTGSTSGKGMKEWAEPFYANSGLTVIQNESRGGGGSDHASFQAVGVPILFAIIADFHDDYHTSRDVVGLIDRESSVQAVNLWRELAFDMAKRPARFEVEQNSGPMRAQPMKVRAGLRSRDSDDDSGIEIIEVTKDGSADKAGILAGDKLIKWNKKDLKDRLAFVEDLRTHEVNDVVQAVVLRAGEEKTIYVTLQGSKAGQ